MKKEKMLIVVVALAAICMTVAAGVKYLSGPVPDQPIMRTAVKQGSVLAASDKMTGANKPEAKTINNPSSNISAFEETVQEFREKAASSLRVTGARTSISPSPENRGEAIAAEQDNGGEEKSRDIASAGRVSMRGPGFSSIPANSAFVSSPSPRHQIRDADPSPGPSDDSHNPDEKAIPGGTPDSGQEGEGVSVSRSLTSGGGGKGEIKVTLSISLSGVRPNGLIVKEYIPKGWEVRESTLPYRNYDPSTGEIKWLLMGNDIRSMEIGYRVVNKETADTETAIHGSYLYNNADGQRVTMRIEDVGGV